MNVTFGSRRLTTQPLPIGFTYKGKQGYIPAHVWELDPASPNDRYRLRGILRYWSNYPHSKFPAIFNAFMNDNPMSLAHLTEKSTDTVKKKKLLHKGLQHIPAFLIHLLPGAGWIMKASQYKTKGVKLAEGVHGFATRKIYALTVGGDPFDVGRDSKTLGLLATTDGLGKRVRLAFLEVAPWARSEGRGKAMPQGSLGEKPVYLRFSGILENLLYSVFKARDGQFSSVEWIPAGLKLRSYYRALMTRMGGKPLWSWTIFGQKLSKVSAQRMIQTTETRNQDRPFDLHLAHTAEGVLEKLIREPSGGVISVPKRGRKEAISYNNARNRYLQILGVS